MKRSRNDPVDTWLKDLANYLVGKPPDQVYWHVRHWLAAAEESDRIPKAPPIVLCEDTKVPELPNALVVRLYAEDNVGLYHAGCGWTVGVGGSDRQKRG